MLNIIVCFAFSERSGQPQGHGRHR